MFYTIIVKERTKKREKKHTISAQDTLGPCSLAGVGFDGLLRVLVVVTVCAVGGVGIGGVGIAVLLWL